MSLNAYLKENKMAYREFYKVFCVISVSSIFSNYNSGTSSNMISFEMLS